MSRLPASPRNPGPGWGFAFLLWAEKWWPRWVFRPLLMTGTWVAVASMPAQRAHSRAYLEVVLGRSPRWVDVWRHFFAFTDLLMMNLKTGCGAPINCRLAPDNRDAFEQLLQSSQPALFGTFHFGCSDLLGYLLSAHGRRVSIIRLQVGNSADTRLLGQRFAGKVSFLWVNNPATLLFDLKQAIESGSSLALKCDRLEYTAKTASFHFLGGNRIFPFTIYHLAVLFEKPVAFCVAVPGQTSRDIDVFASPVFYPNPAISRDENLQIAHRHFQAVLNALETKVREHPFFWFNFLPLNPLVADD